LKPMRAAMACMSWWPGVSSENLAGQEFHARLGYVPCGRVLQAGYKWGRYLDLVLMQKILT